MQRNGLILTIASFLFLAFVLIFSWIFNFFGWNWFPESIVAFGTLLLALATYQLAQTTINENAKLIKENNRLAEQNITFRKQERKAELRNEILKWAVDINSFAIQHGTQVLILPGTENEFVSEHIDKWLFDVLEPARSWSEYAETIATTLGPAIFESTGELKTKLRIQIGFLQKVARGEINDSGVEQANKIKMSYDQIHGAAVSLIKEIAWGDTADL